METQITFRPNRGGKSRMVHALFLLAFMLLSLAAKAQSLTFHTPSSVTVWEVGQTYDITFTIGGSQPVYLEGIDVFQNSAYRQGVFPSDFFAPGTHSVSITLDYGIGYLNSSDNFVRAYFYDQNWNLYFSSSDFFAISTPSNVIAAIVSPSNWSIWEVNTAQNINFVSYGISAVNLEISIDGGASWETISTNYSAVEGVNNFSWNVGHSDLVQGNSYPEAIIRISSFNDPAIFLTSSLFTINFPNPSIDLIHSPAAGHWFANGIAVVLAWQSTAVLQVNLYYSIDGGSSWETIANGVSSSSSYSEYFWQIQENQFNAIHPNALIKVEDASNAGLFLISNTFVLGNQGPLSIQSPILNTDWVLANNESVIFENNGQFEIYLSNFRILKNGIEIKTVNVFEYIQGGQSYTNNLLVDPDFFTAGNDYQIVAFYYWNMFQNNLNLYSEFFSVLQPVNQVVSLASPSASSIWYNGNTESIDWYSYGVSNVNVHFSLDGGTSWQIIAANVNCAEGLNSIDWTLSLNGLLPNQPVATIIRVADVTDINNAAFSNNLSIIEPDAMFSYFMSPTMDAWWYNGGEFEIKWVSLGIPVVDIEYTIDNGQSWNTIISGLSNIQSGINTYTWTIGANEIVGMNNGVSRIRLVNASGNGGQQMFSDIFALSEFPIVSYLTPTAATVWSAGTTVQVTLSNNYNQNLNLYNLVLYMGEDEYVTELPIWGPLAPGTGIYSVDLPFDLATRSDYYFHLALDNGLFYMSATSDLFTIEAAEAITEISNPNPASFFTNGTNQLISWTNYGISEVNIDYSLDNGSTWQSVVQNYPVTFTFENYNWNISITGLNQGQEYDALIRVSNATNPNVFLISSIFTIYESEPSISAVSPLISGEWWSNGQHKIISWNSFAVSSVDIEYSTDLGNSWNTIVSNYSNIVNGANDFLWEIPSNLFTAIHVNSFIRVKESNSNLSALSTQMTLSNLPMFNFVTPTNSTVWENNQVVNIEGENIAGFPFTMFSFMVYRDNVLVSEVSTNSLVNNGLNSYPLNLSTQIYTPSANYQIRASYYNSNGMFFVTDSDFFTIVNEGTESFLFVNTNEIEVDHLAAQHSDLSISTNETWTASSDQSWLVLSQTTGTANAVLSFNVSENTLNTARTANITINAGTFSEVVQVTQFGTPFINVSTTNLTLAAQQGSTVSLEVSSNTNWIVSSNQSWLSTSNASGFGDLIITLTGDANNTGASRTATVTVTDEADLIQTVVVTQEAMPFLQVSINELFIDGLPNSAVDFGITSNSTWIIESSESWLTADVTSGSNNQTVTLTADANNSGAERTATITVTSGQIIETISVTQSEAPSYLFVSEEELILTSEENSNGMFEITSNVSWTVESNQSWLSVSTPVGNNDALITVTAQANTSTESRTATVTVTDGITSAEIIVTQEAEILADFLAVSINAIELNPTSGSEGEFEITSNVTWTVESNQTWLSISPENGNGDALVTLTAQANASVNDRIAVVTVSGGGITETITVTQKGDASAGLADWTKKFTIYPNPSSDFLFVDFEQEYEKVILVYDIKGQLIEEIHATEKQVVLNIQGYAKGIYTVSILSQNQRQMAKIVKH